MEIRDLAIKYKALYHQVILMINNIKELGFDVTIYQNELNEISNRVNNSVKESNGKAYATARYELDYSTGINELNKLIFKLDTYDIYFKVLNSCDWLSIKIRNKDITKDELNTYVSEMAYNLKQLMKSNTLDYDKEKHIVEKAYKVAYEIIRLELIIKGDSQLYSFIISNNIDTSYFNILIKNDLSSINMDSYIYIKEKIFELRKKGINTSYFDIDLIRMLLIIDNNEYKDVINKNANEIIASLKDNRDKIEILSKKIGSTYKETDDAKYSQKIDLKDLRKRIVSLALTSSIIIGGGVGVQKLAKAAASGDKYLMTTEIYSSDLDETKKDSAVVIIKDEPENEVIIREYDKYENESRRHYKEYDVSNVRLESAKDYYDYGLDNFHVEPEEKLSRISAGDTISNYQEEYIEIIKSNYEYLEKGLDKSLYIFLLVLFYAFYLFLTAMISTFLDIEDNGIKSMINDIKDLLEDLANDKSVLKSRKEDITNYTNEIMKLINEKDELKESFVKIYNANKYLLNNPEKLFKKVEELTNNDPRQLVKSKK